ncbi:MAG: hypothetical protein HYY85_08990 [Deltaproteobacteria bacterium]|nr:hypothetical protein [Deltaproteobacteria bacterium]
MRKSTRIMLVAGVMAAFLAVAYIFLRNGEENALQERDGPAMAQRDEVGAQPAGWAQTMYRETDTETAGLAMASGPAKTPADLATPRKSARRPMASEPVEGGMDVTATRESEPKEGDKPAAVQADDAGPLPAWWAQTVYGEQPDAQAEGFVVPAVMEADDSGPLPVWWAKTVYGEGPDAQTADFSPASGQAERIADVATPREPEENVLWEGEPSAIEEDELTVVEVDSGSLPIWEPQVL